MWAPGHAVFRVPERGLGSYCGLWCFQLNAGAVTFGGLLGAPTFLHADLTLHVASRGERAVEKKGAPTLDT